MNEEQTCAQKAVEPAVRVLINVFLSDIFVGINSSPPRSNIGFFSCFFRNMNSIFPYNLITNIFAREAAK